MNYVFSGGGMSCNFSIIQATKIYRGEVIRIFQRPRFTFLKACEQNEIGCFQFTCLQSHHEKPIISQLLGLKPLGGNQVFWQMMVLLWCHLCTANSEINEC